MVKINSNAAPVLFQRVNKVYGKDIVAVDDINLEIKAVKSSHYWDRRVAAKPPPCA